MLIVLSFAFQASGEIFENNGVGAGSLGMAGQCIATGSDLFSMYWNPGAIGFSEANAIGGMFANLYGSGDLVHQFVGMNMVYKLMPLKSQLVSFAGYESFGSSSLLLEKTLTAGVSLNYFKKYSFGIALKYLALSIGDGNDKITSGAFACDIGVDFKVTDMVYIGYAGKNIFSTPFGYTDAYQSDTYDRSVKIPSYQSFGLGVVNKKYGKAEIGSDLSSFKIAAEGILKSIIRIRYGFSYGFATASDSDGKQLRSISHNAGLGVHIAAFKFDYALSLNSALPLSHFISFSAAFGSPVIIKNFGKSN
jgi:hypothetical protein